MTNENQDEGSSFIKKASIITILDVTNFGSYLQAYALGRILEKQGVFVEYVNYVRPISSWTQTSKRRWNKHGGGIKGVGAVVYGLCIDVFSLRNCKSFLTSRMPVSKKYRSLDELQKAPPKADIYITGSDQVWNPIHNQGIDRAFFLDYADKEALRYAYAASIGIDQIPEQYKDEMVQLLSKYDYIATREYSGQKLLEEEGVNNVLTVLDPTLLFNRTMWEGVVKDKPFVKTEPYLLVYSVERDRKFLVSEVAKQIAEKLELKVYFVTPRWFSSSVKCNKAIYFASPEKFLSLFLNADFAVVSSFHGTAFSVNLNVPFVSVIPGRFNSRISSLLGCVGLEKKMVDDVSTGIDEAANKINWETVNEQLSRERTRSLEYINNIVRYVVNHTGNPGD